MATPPILHVPGPGVVDDDDDDEGGGGGVNAGLDVIVGAPIRRELLQNVNAVVVVAILVEWARNGDRRCAIWANILEWVGILEPRTANQSVLWG